MTDRTPDDPSPDTRDGHDHDHDHDGGEDDETPLSPADVPGDLEPVNNPQDLKTRRCLDCGVLVDDVVVKVPGQAFDACPVCTVREQIEDLTLQLAGEADTAVSIAGDEYDVDATVAPSVVYYAEQAGNSDKVDGVHASTLVSALLGQMAGTPDALGDVDLDLDLDRTTEFAPGWDRDRGGPHDRDADNGEAGGDSHPSNG